MPEDNTYETPENEAEWLRDEVDIILENEIRAIHRKPSSIALAASMITTVTFFIFLFTFIFMVNSGA